MAGAPDPTVQAGFLPSAPDVTPARDTLAMVVMDLDRPLEVAPSLGEWQPLAGAALLDRLRITGRPRPKADPALGRELRQRLDEALVAELQAGEAAVGPAGTAPGSSENKVESRAQMPTRSTPLVVTKDRLNRALSGDSHGDDAEFGKRTPTMPLACGALVDVLFRQLVTVGSIGDAMSDGLAALAVDDRQAELVSWIEGLSKTERAQLRAEVDHHADGLRRRWPALDPAWLPRTQESMRAGLAGGAIELSGRVDLAIGTPSDETASVAILEVKSGARRIEHRSELHFYALIETLRSVAPPFVVATYYTRTGEIDVDPVTDELLHGACRRTLVGVRGLLETAVER